MECSNAHSYPDENDHFCIRQTDTLSFSIDELQLVSGVDFGMQSISGRPAGSRCDRHRSGRESSPHRSPPVSPLETLSSFQSNS